MEMSKTGPVISILQEESKDLGRMSHPVNKLVSLHEVLTLRDLNISFLILLKQQITIIVIQSASK